MALLDTAQGRIETHEWGDGCDLVLMLHASATGPQTLSGLAKHLLRPNLRIVAPAFAGYGRTQFNTPSSPIAANLHIARHILNNHSGSSRIVFGHSMGGLIALLTALDAGDADVPPDALVLYEPILPGLLDRTTTEGAAALAWDRNVISSLRTAVDNGDRAAGVRKFVEAWNEVKWACLPDAVRSHLITNAENLMRETTQTSEFELDHAALKALQLPTLLLQGEASPMMTHLISQRASDLLPNAHLVVVPRANHLAPVSSPALIGAELFRFCEDQKLS